MDNPGQQSSTDPTPTEYNFMMILAHPRKVNEPWLEKQAMAMEAALLAECAGIVLGPSVSANFEENGFELDLTVEATSDAEANEKFRQAIAVVERVGGISLDREETQVRSSYHSEGKDGDHDAAVLVC